MTQMTFMSPDWFLRQGKEIPSVFGVQLFILCLCTCSVSLLEEYRDCNLHKKLKGVTSQN